MEHNTILSGGMPKHTRQRASETNTERCFLLELPGELRNEILGLALYYPNGVTIDCISQKLLTQHPLALTATCKQIRKECHDLLFAQNGLQLEIHENPTGRDARELEAYCRKLLLRSQLGSKFQGVHVVTKSYRIGPSGPIAGIFPVHFRWVFDVCHECRCAMLWSFKVIAGTAVAAYSIPMQSLELALEGADSSVQPGYSNVRNVLWFFHQRIKRDIKTYFNYWRKKRDRIETS